MKATNCTQEDLNKALARVNKKYGGNIQFNPDSDGPSRFTLRPRKPGPGSKLNTFYVMGLEWAKKRRVYACCWHVHGDFFDALFEINPDAVVHSLNKKITKDNGNWEDFQVGSALYPAYASECCECDNGG